MKTSLHEIGRFEDRLSFLYVDRAIIRHTANAIAIHEFDWVTEVPMAALATLMLGPGTKITHEAVKALADANCLVIWAGEEGVRFYASGMGGSRHSRNLLRQAALALDERTRLQVVVRMYLKRFPGEEVDPNITLQQLRGKEGIRVREAYAQASRTTGVPWTGRSYHRKNWFAGDPVNRALSAANACLYGLVHAAILSVGYSPAIGFIHSGKQLSFVYDVADLYKVELVIPLAFNVAKAEPEHLEREVRSEARRRFHRAKLLQRILPDIRDVMKTERSEEQTDEFIDDPAKPSAWWEPSFGSTTPIGQIMGHDRDGDAA